MHNALRVALLFCCLCTAVSTAFATGPLPDVIVPGKPPITCWAVYDHVRLMEFVLGTRLTTGQKEVFLATLKKECAGMDGVGRAAFLEARELVASMATMAPDQREIVREVLREDFENTAGEDASDPAAQLYTQVRDGVSKTIASQGSYTVTLQALEAFSEYVGFARAPEKPEKLSGRERDGLMRALTDGFSKLPEASRTGLNGFDRTWYLLKAGWLAADDATRTRWKAGLKESADGAVSGKGIGMAIDLKLWQELKDVAAKAGETPDGWTATPALIVW